MSLTRFTRLGFDVRTAFSWSKKEILAFTKDLCKNPEYGIPKDQISHLKEADRLLNSSSDIFINRQNGMTLPQPYMFPFYNKSLPLYTIHDVLGYIMTSAINPVLSKQQTSREDLMALLALYCKFMSEVHIGPAESPSTGHVSYSSFPLQHVLFSSESLPITAFSSSIPGSLRDIKGLKTMIQELRFQLLQDSFGDIAKLIQTHNPSQKIFGSGAQLSLAGPANPCFGHCAETYAWISLRDIVKPESLYGMTLDALPISTMKDFDISKIREQHKDPCINCQAILKYGFKANLENFRR